MRNTTVSVLLIFLSSFVNAQDALLSKKIARLTTISIGENVLQHPDDNARIIELNTNDDASYLTNQGVEIYRRLSKNVFLVRNDDVVKRLSMKEVKKNHAVNYQWKIADQVTERTGTFVVRKKENAALHSIPSRKIISVDGSYLRVNIALESDFIELVNDANVIYIGRESFEAVEETRVLDLNLNPNHVNQIHHAYPDIDGNGITISMKELRYNENDIDLLGRHVPSSLGATETSSHATEMATIAAGSGNSFVTGQGVAPGAKITSSTFEDLFPDSDSEFSSLNVKLQNHSYGTVVESFYGVLAEAYDQSANRNPTLLHVFSSGNQATASAPSGKYKELAGYANITGNSKMAKNALVVGSSDTTGNPSFFSSRGPAHDGRVKPEVVAYSTAGSSNSAALVSGVSALLQQAYKEKTGVYPPSALLKAVLINGAKDVHLPQVDFTTGFGNVDAFRSLKMIQDGNTLSGILTAGATRDFILNVPSSAKNLKVTMVWNDPAASADASFALVNDLDLIISKDADAWQPWILNSSPTISSLTMPAVRGEDHLNNIEQITIETPVPGDYQITVSGDLATSSQEFFIAYQWESDQTFEWKYPTASDHFSYNGETGTYFYWNSTLSAATGDIQYSVDDGNSWTTIKSSVDLAKGFYRWDISSFPDHTAEKARARMVTASGNFVSDEFTVSKTWFPEVAFNCGDSVMFQWRKQSGINIYEAQTLIGNAMTPIMQTADTFLILKKASYSSDYFSIQPILPNGKKILRTPAVSYSLLGSCYITSFTEEVAPDEGIYLNVGVATTYGIMSIVIERQLQSGEFVQVTDDVLASGLTTRLLDEDPIQGLNRYRARLNMVNGAVIFSSELEVFFITNDLFIVFPNPATAGTEINVFSGRAEGVQATFELLSNTGSLVRSVKLSSDREFVSLTNVDSGIYMYRIISADAIIRGKIFVK